MSQASEGSLRHSRALADICHKVPELASQNMESIAIFVTNSQRGQSSEGTEVREIDLTADLAYLSGRPRLLPYCFHMP